MSDQRSNPGSEYSRFDPLPNTVAGTDVGDVGDTSSRSRAGMSGQTGAVGGQGMQSGGQTGGATDKAKETMDKAKDTVTSVQHKASEIGGQATKKASQMGDQATQKADQGMDRAAGGLDSIATTLRERGQSMGDGQMGHMATMAADKLEHGAEMLRSKDTDQLMTELESMIRRRPVESLLIAAGAGYLLSRAL